MLPQSPEQRPDRATELAPAPAPFVPSVHLLHSDESGKVPQQATASGSIAFYEDTDKQHGGGDSGTDAQVCYPSVPLKAAQVPTASASITPPASPAKDCGVVAQQPSSLSRASLLPLQELLDTGKISPNVFKIAMQKLVDAESTVSAAAEPSKKTEHVAESLVAEQLEALPEEMHDAPIQWEEEAGAGWLPCDACTSEFLETEYITRKRAWEEYDDA